MINNRTFRIILCIALITLMSACSAGEQAAPAQAQESAADQAQPAEVADAQAPAIESALLPKMVLVDSDDQGGLTFYNLAGQPQATLDTPGLIFGEATHVHVAGRIPVGGNTAPIVYLTYEQQEALLLNRNNEIGRLALTPQFFQLRGAMGEAVVAYSLIPPEGQGVTSELYAGNLDSLPNASPVYTLFDNETYFAIAPMAVVAQNGNALGIWYTHSAWGIGGDIIYPINKGLYYYDLTTGDDLQYLDGSHNPQGMSPDMSWAASVGFNTGDLSLRIENLQNGSTQHFPLDSESDRGAGDAFFSPDNQYVGWIEGSGSMMALEPNYSSRIRIGMTDGGIIQDVSDAQIAQAAGYSKVSFMKPVGWLDNQTLLVEVRKEDWGQAALVKIDALSGAVSEYCAGTFSGFAY